MSLEEELEIAEQKVADLKLRISQEKLALQETVKQEYRYTFLPPERPVYDKVYDDSLVWFRLEGICVNKAECEAVGHWSFFEGGMNYLYNTLTHKIVMTAGGGSIHMGGFRGDEGNEEAMQILSDYLTANPNGGDITKLVNAWKKKHKED